MSLTPHSLCLRFDAGVPASRKVVALISVGYPHPDNVAPVKNRKELAGMRRYV
jgi:hypothetical protein